MLLSSESCVVIKWLASPYSSFNSKYTICYNLTCAIDKYKVYLLVGKNKGWLFMCVLLFRSQYGNAFTEYSPQFSTIHADCSILLRR